MINDLLRKMVLILHFKELEDSANLRHPLIILDPATLESLQLEVKR